MDNAGDRALASRLWTLLGSTYLHVYCHCSLTTLPRARVWTSSVSRGRYAAVGAGRGADESANGVEDGVAEEPDGGEEGRLDVDEEDPLNGLDAVIDQEGVDTHGGGRAARAEAPEGGIPGHELPRTWHSSTLHLSLHIGLALLITVASAAALAAWVAFLEFTTASAAYSIDLLDAQALAAGSDYVLDPAWDFDGAPRRREYRWVVTDAVLNPDGVYRDMMVINGQFPGPLIECNEGDTIAVQVVNEARNATSMHWHGLYQNGTNHMDGTVGVTQCPIPTGHSFLYEFKVEGQSGTYWYHGHYGLQAADGLLGPVVVHSRREGAQRRRQEYATDRVLMVQDHYHDLTGALLMDYLQPGRENAEPVPDSSLLNGRNVVDCDDFPGRRCDNTTASLPTIALDPRRAHRLRVINTGLFAELQVSIDEHEFAVTEVDGTDVAPTRYNRFRINPAQRYSIVIPPRVGDDAATAPSYWFRARMTTSCFAEKKRGLDPLLKAIVHYVPAREEDGEVVSLPGTTTATAPLSPPPLPVTEEWPGDGDVTCHDMDTTDLVPVDAVRPPEPDTMLYLRSNFEIGAWQLSRGFFNTTSWRPNVQLPLLARAIGAMGEGGVAAAALSTTTGGPALVDHAAFDAEHELVVRTAGIQTIDLAIQNFDDGSHPFHLHGAKFFVLAAGRGQFDAAAVYPSLDTSNPLRRDTATIEAYSWILMRFVADNPGVWSFHCHNGWHSEAGLLMNFLVRSDVVGTWQVPEANARLCAAGGLERGSPPRDEIWFGRGVEEAEDE